jgi:hypothetical protein
MIEKLKIQEKNNVFSLKKKGTFETNFLLIHNEKYQNDGGCNTPP